MMPISPQRNYNRGFTLIEILLVLVIFAGIAAIGVPRLFRTSDNIRKITRQMTALTKEIRNRAKLKNSTMRLVLDMSAEPHQYWVEMSPGSRPIPANLYEEKSDDDDEQAPTNSQFARDEFLTKKPKDLPKGIYFGAVETINTKEPITQGIAYIHYFPEGFVEASIIQLTNRQGLTWTLVISPLTGQAEIIEEEKFLKDLNP
jgi:general secretion pathway protein H